MYCSLAGHTLHLRRKGLVSCLYATCAAAARSAAPIKSLHVMVLCNIQCHSAARYIPATTHRDTECELYGTCQPLVNHIHYPLHKRYQLLCNSWHKSRIGMTPDPSSSSEGCGPPDYSLSRWINVAESNERD